MSEYAGTVALSVVIATTGAVLEKKVMRDLIPYLYEPSTALPVLPRSYGMVIIVLTCFSFWHLVFGFKVGDARATAKADAEKDLETDTSRYDYPHLYVAGTSEHAIAFNNVQRAHQHVLESITQMYIASLVAALLFPLTATATTICWAFGRICWSTAYAEHGSEARYSHCMSGWVWRGLLINYLLSLVVAFFLILGCK